MSASQSQLLGVAGILGTIVVPYIVARVTAGTSKHATDTTRELTKEANQITRDANAVTGLNALVEQLQEELRELRRRCSALEGDFEAMKRETARKDTLIRHLIAYVKTLQNRLRTSGISVPEAPAGLDLEGGPLA